MFSRIWRKWLKHISKRGWPDTIWGTWKPRFDRWVERHIIADDPYDSPENVKDDWPEPKWPLFGLVIIALGPLFWLVLIWLLGGVT